MPFVRKCLRCGNADLSRRWDSRTKAADDGAFKAEWACPNCAWPDFDIVEHEEPVAVGARAGEGNGPGSEMTDRSSTIDQFGTTRPPF